MNDITHIGQISKFTIESLIDHFSDTDVKISSSWLQRKYRLSEEGSLKVLKAVNKRRLDKFNK